MSWAEMHNTVNYQKLRNHPRNICLLIVNHEWNLTKRKLGKRSFLLAVLPLNEECHTRTGVCLQCNTAFYSILT